MKKFLFAAILFAGITFGFAKDNVQGSTSNDNNLVKTEIVNGKEVTTYTFNSLEEAQEFIEDCTVITAAYTMIDGELELLSVCETTTPCILEEPGVRIAVVIV